MRNLRLLSTTAAMLLLGVGAVWAQDMKTNEKAGASTAQENTPAEKMAPASKSDQRKATEKNESDSKQLKSQKMDRGAATGAAAKGPADAADNADPKSKTMNKADESGMGATSPAAKSTDEGKHNATVGSAKLSTEQRTKIAAVVQQHKVTPVQLNVPVRVGTRVPDSVRSYPLPQEVFAIYPEWHGYDYILVGDEIVVVDPRTHEIVAILEA
jgi:Protein of unknown function (DUF1236)